MLLAACSKDEDPFFTATEDDYPRILNTDIPEWSNGEPKLIASIVRTENFQFEVVATPRHYTTVSWYLDDELVYEGDEIDMPVLAGSYILKIVATTTKGLSTSRTCRLEVRPAEGDPVPANKQRERLVIPGTDVTLHGTNMEHVTKIVIGGHEIPCTYNEEGYIAYTVPADLAEGEYRIRLIDADGVTYGGGFITLSLNPDYEVEEIVLWEGHHYVSWDKPDGDPNKTFTALQDELGKLKAGTVIAVTYTIEPADGYHQMQLMTAWWTLLPGHEKLEFSEDGVYEYTLTDEALDLLAAQNGFLIGGHGFYVDKIVSK